MRAALSTVADHTDFPDGDHADVLIRRFSSALCCWMDGSILHIVSPTRLFVAGAAWEQRFAEWEKTEGRDRKALSATLHWALPRRFNSSNRSIKPHAWTIGYGKNGDGFSSQDQRHKASTAAQHR